MKKLLMLLTVVLGLNLMAGEHDMRETSGNFACLEAGEQVYQGNLACVGTNGLAYAANSTAATGATVCGVFQSSAAVGEKVLVKRGGFILDNDANGTLAKADIGQTCYAVSNNAWTVTKTSGGLSVGKVADVRDDGSVVVVVGQ